MGNSSTKPSRGAKKKGHDHNPTTTTAPPSVAAIAILRPQPTPISAILRLYQKSNQPPLVIEKLDDIDIKTQLQCLDPDKCNTANKRNEIIRQFNNTDLQQNAFKRIRFKSILSEYHKHWYQIRDTHFKMVEHWNERDFSLNVIVHFIKHHEDGKLGTEDKELKRLVTTWRFLDYLGQFFDKKGFNGQEFISKHVPNNQDPQAKMKSSGFGLTIVKEVCKQFDQKTGQYTKVKKQLSAWAKNNVERYQEECAFTLDDIKENAVEEAGNIGSGANNNAQNADNNASNANVKAANSPQSKSSNNTGAIPKSKGERWYWFCEDKGIWWVPYPDDQQDIIENAWVSNKPNVIVGVYKIEFIRGNPGIACGDQHNYTIYNSWRRGVLRGKPDKQSMINGTICEKQPRQKPK
eukprot:441640_1